MKLYKKIISVFLAGTLIFTGIHFSKINKKIETKAELIILVRQSRQSGVARATCPG